MLPYRPADVDALRRALGRVLRGESDGEVLRRGGESPSLAPGPGFVAAARRHRVAAYLSTHVDLLELPDPVRDDLVVAGRHERMRALEVARSLHRATDALREAEVPALAFKGVALSALAYGEATLRGYGDVDLLVRPDDVERAHDALRSAGWHTDPTTPGPASGWVWRFMKRHHWEVTLHGSPPIDLHWSLAPARGALPTFPALWDRHQTVDVLGRDVATLGPVDTLRHTAAHAARDEWQWLRSLVDLRLVQQAVGPGARQEAGRERVVRRAAEVADACFGHGDVPVKVRRTQSEEPSQFVALSAPPGKGALLVLRRHTQGSRSLADVRRAVTMAAVNVQDLGGISESRAVPARGQVVRRRIGKVVGRFRLWRRGRAAP